MSRQVIIDTNELITRVAVRTDGKLTDFSVESENEEKIAGNIYMGKVQNILPGLQAAFVDIGLSKNGFLYAGDITANIGEVFGLEENTPRQEVPIKKLVSNGQEILVQVVKEGTSTKGPRISTHLSMAGRLCVLVPGVDYIGISRRIEDPAERARLKTEVAAVKPEGMGVIVRTVARGVSGQDIARELSALVKIYEGLMRKAKTTRAPALLLHDENMVRRAVRDLLSSDVDRFVLNDGEAYQAAQNYARIHAPELVERIELYGDDQPIFDVFNIENEIKSATERKVWLKSGGFLVFDKTEALTTIDVNTGRFVGTNNNLQDTLFDLNCEAAIEIARQIRLRDISGIIIVDFIDMEVEENRRALLDVLKNACKDDRTRMNVVGFTGLGLVEMTRKKERRSLSSVTEHSCPVCQGSGYVARPEHVLAAALRDIARMRAAGYMCEFVISLAPEAVRATKKVRKMPGIYWKSSTTTGPKQYNVECVHSQAELAGAAPLGEK